MDSEKRGTERAKLAAMAVMGIVVYQVILVGPFVLLMALNPWAGYFGVWPYVGVALFFLWVLQPSHSVPGEPLRPDEAPPLFAALHDLTERMKAPRLHEVRLSDEYNAAAAEVPWPWQPWRKRRVLVLGVPLLATSSTDTVLSVVAHELGHFSHRHGRLGHWIYRTRAEWEGYARESLEDTSVLDRGASTFAHWFAPRFSRLAFAYSRQCEYEADAQGAVVVGALQMSHALVKVALLGRRWACADEEMLSALLAKQDRPPNRWMLELQALVLGQPLEEDEFHLLSTEKADAHDTHPRTLERVEAMGVAAGTALHAVALPLDVAGAAWLLKWDDVIDGYDQRWRHRHARGWHLEHVRQRCQRERWAQLSAAGDTGLRRALLELEYGEADVAEDIARALNEGAAADKAGVLYVQGVAQLKRSHADGVAVLEACIKADPRWAVAARSAMALHEALMDDRLRDRNRNLLKRAWVKQAKVRGLALDLLQQGQVSAASLDDDAETILRAAWQGADVVAGAWCAAIEKVEHDGRSYPVVILVLRLRTDALLERGWTEDDVRDDAVQLLGGVVPEPVVRLVWTTYTTEALSPELDALLTDWAESRHPCCLVVPKPGESVAAGARAAALR
jgi:Zn-dependent protease with chaperone function